MAEEAHGELGAAGAHQSREADDLALADLQVDVLDEVTLRILGVIDVPVLDLEDDIADGAVLALRITVGELTSDHALDDAVFVDLAALLVQRLDGLAVADDRDAVRNVADLVQLMGDNDAGNALLLELKHDVKQML